MGHFLHTAPNILRLQSPFQSMSVTFGGEVSPWVHWFVRESRRKKESQKKDVLLVKKGVLLMGPDNGVHLIFHLLVSPKQKKKREIQDQHPLSVFCHGEIYHHPLYNLSLYPVCVFQALSSILARSKDQRLRRAHIDFPHKLKSQGDGTTVDTNEITNGTTGERDVGDTEGVG